MANREGKRLLNIWRNKMSPCKDCITLAICKSQFISISQHSLSEYGAVVLVLIPKCSILREFALYQRKDCILSDEIRDIIDFYKEEIK